MALRLMGKMPMLLEIIGTKGLTMSSFTRRDLLKTSMAVSAGLALLKPTARVLGANDEIRIATIGVGGQGSYHTEIFSKIPGVRYVAVCDPDQFHVNARVKFFADKGLMWTATPTCGSCSSARTSTPSPRPPRTTGTRW